MLRTPFLRTSVLGISAGALLGAVPWGCAAGSGEPQEDSTSTGAPSSGGTGAQGGFGGEGGRGELCDQDCGAISAPDCHEAVCNDGSYPGAVGSCVVVPAADGSDCDDGQFCTTADTCQQGSCTGGPPNDCGMDASECEAVACDEASRSCAIEATDEDMPCVSGDLCIMGSTCQQGVCVGGTTNDCFFAPVPDDCHVAACNPLNGMCEPVTGNEGGPCTDTSDLCTVGKTCSAGQCQGGTPKDCSQLTQGCNTGVCDASNGTCTAMAVGEGQPCDDLDACTSGETCSASVCGMGSPVTACSQVADGCCPSNCTAQTDYDCACPGILINGICVFLPSPSNSYTKTQAQAACQALGAGWDLCAPTLLCDSQSLTYLGASGCDCAGGPSSCNCSGINVYVHVNTTTNSPYYIRASQIPNCGSPACTNSVSASCGVALCCKP